MTSFKDIGKRFSALTLSEKNRSIDPSGKTLSILENQWFSGWRLKFFNDGRYRIIWSGAEDESDENIYDGHWSQSIHPRFIALTFIEYGQDDKQTESALLYLTIQRSVVNGDDAYSVGILFQYFEEDEEGEDDTSKPIKAKFDCVEIFSTAVFE